MKKHIIIGLLISFIISFSYQIGKVYYERWSFNEENLDDVWLSQVEHNKTITAIKRNFPYEYEQLLSKVISAVKNDLDIHDFDGAFEIGKEYFYTFQVENIHLLLGADDASIKRIINQNNYILSLFNQNENPKLCKNYLEYGSQALGSGPINLH